MIFSEHKAIFFHIGKTAGFAVEQLLCPGDRDASVADLQKLFGYDRSRRIYLQHASAAVTREMAGEKIFTEYYTFTVVRNPYARLVSVYYYLIDLHRKRYGSFENYINALPQILEDKALFNGSHHIPQTCYTHINGCPVCDAIVYFEHLPESLDPIRQRLHIDAPLEKLNVIHRPQRPTKPPAEIYTPKMVETVQQVFKEEFELLGYSPNPECTEPLYEEIPPGSLRK